MFEIYSFGRADWQEIKESLAERGVDLDAQMVGKFVPGQRWWLSNDSAVRLPLRDELIHMAWHYQDRFIPDQKRTTPAQHAEALQKGLRGIENALFEIDRMAIDRTEAKEYTDDDFWADVALCDRIQRYIDKQQERIDRLRAMPSPRVANARTVHNDYWRELTRLWGGLLAAPAQSDGSRFTDFCWHVRGRFSPSLRRENSIRRSRASLAIFPERSGRGPKSQGA
jgi:hypothetical protein